MIKKNLLAVSGAVAVGISVAGVAEAGMLQNGTGLTDPTQVITFDEIVLPADSPITNEYAGLGVEFSPNLVYDTLPTPIPNQDGNHVKNFFPVVNPFSIEFTENVSSAAFAFATNTGTSTFTALLDGMVVESFSAATTVFDPNNFFGFTDILFDEIQVQVGGGGGVMRMDNIQFEVAATPEPTSLLGLLLVGAGAAYSLKRKKTA